MNWSNMWDKFSLFKQNKLLPLPTSSLESNPNGAHGLDESKEGTEREKIIGGEMDCCTDGIQSIKYI